MTRNHLRCSTPVLLSCLMLVGPWVVLAAPCPPGEPCVCLQCPLGQEPSTPYNQAVVPDAVAECRGCPSDTFSDSYGPDQCTAHTQCESLNRRLVTPGSSEADAVCGSCLKGFRPEVTPGSSTLRSCVRKSPVRERRNAGKSTKAGGVGVAGTPVGGANSTAVRAAEEKRTEYAVFILVPVFCVMGLLGILICNLLKKKGYTCTGDKESREEEEGELQKEEEQTEDTISALVRLITEKKENAAALEELFLEYEKKQPTCKPPSFKFPGLPHLPQFRSLPRLCSHHHHLHTINGLAPLTGFGCSRCSQKKWPELLTPLTSDTPKTPSIPSSPSMGPVHSVGRFQVAQITEGDAIIFGGTPPDLSDSDSLYFSNSEPAEDTSLLGTCSSNSSTKSRQEMNA